jgi:hypothetical protein
VRRSAVSIAGNGARCDDSMLRTALPALHAHVPVAGEAVQSTRATIAACGSSLAHLVGVAAVPPSPQGAEATGQADVAPTTSGGQLDSQVGEQL